MALFSSPTARRWQRYRSELRLAQHLTRNWIVEGASFINGKRANSSVEAEATLLVGPNLEMQMVLVCREVQGIAALAGLADHVVHLNCLASLHIHMLEMGVEGVA